MLAAAAAEGAADAAALAAGAADGALDEALDGAVGGGALLAGAADGAVVAVGEPAPHAVARTPTTKLPASAANSRLLSRISVLLRAY